MRELMDMTDFFSHSFHVASIVLACYVPVGAGQRFHKNRPHHGLALHLGGEKTYSFEGGTRLEVCKNKISYLPKGSNYEIERQVNGDCYAINFDLVEEVSFKPFTVSIKNADRFLLLFKNAQRIWRSKERGYEMECTANLYHILCALQNEAELGYTPMEKVRLIAPAVQYLNEHYTDPTLTVSLLAELAGITPEYVRQIFRSIYGDSPRAYVNRKRLSNAMELLDSGMYSITEAAEASGYVDMSHFSRAFKGMYGLSARQYLISRSDKKAPL